MYQVHDWAKVRELVREGVPKQRIAEQLGCSRTTVYRLAGLAEPPGYERRPAGSQLEPFKDAIAAMLLEDDAAPATVIREHLQRRGYARGVSILKDYLRELRPLYRGRDYQRTVYAPGEILQADWWDTGLAVPVGKGQARRAYGFVTTLPFSAAHSVVFTHSQTTADVLPALLGCLARLGGVPAKLVMDRDSSLVARAPRRRARPVDELAALPDPLPETDRRLEVRASRDDFDFGFARGLKREAVLHLAQLDFLEEHKNVIFLGSPSTGKTHLSIALAV